MSAGALQLADLQLPQEGAVVRLDALSGTRVGVIRAVSYDDHDGLLVQVQWAGGTVGDYPAPALLGPAWTVTS